MEKIRLRDIDGYKEFKTKAAFFKCEDEYPGWTGKEKFIIVSDVSEKELLSKFSLIMDAMKPYLILDSKYGEIRKIYKNTERSIERFICFHQTPYSLDETSEYHHKELVDNKFIDRIDINMDLKQALSVLTDLQRTRLINYYINGMTFEEIAKLEGKHKKSITESINAANKKLKKFLKHTPPFFL